jgi:hypothetical protein
MHAACYSMLLMVLPIIRSIDSLISSERDLLGGNSY